MSQSKKRAKKSRVRRAKAALPLPLPLKNELAAKSLFPIVAIGASAGGLEALELFLKHVPATSDMAFVIVQHLDPTQKGMLVELLQRTSPLPVVQVTDRVRIRPGQVYVIPPNKDMSLLHGVLHLLVPAAPRGLRLPIDFFFRSLADDVGPRAIGVILSGMGSDGTLGLRAIRERAGSTFVQAPASAKFDGMPGSAIAAGLADVVAPVEQLPGKIVDYLTHAHHLARPDAPEPDSKTQGSLEKIIALLRAATGHDFTPYKTSTLYRRVERRMGLHKIDQIQHYVRYVRENPDEGKLLFNELLIGVTSFFRDPGVWNALEREVAPGLLARCAPHTVLRAWTAACSTGEEAYSLAIVLQEELERSHAGRNISIQIFATDLDGSAIAKARRGVYPLSIAADVSPERLARFFVQEERGYRVRKEIRDLVVFATQDILQDPPFTKLDLLTCRNLLIYLTGEVQQKLFAVLHYSLKPGGTLVLGNAETVGASAELFAPIDSKSRLYRRREKAPGSPAGLDLPSRQARAAALAGPSPSEVEPPAGVRPPSLQTLVEGALLQRFGPAAVLASSQGDVLFVSGRTGKYLELPAGKTNWNVLAMARDGLRHPLGAAFSKAMQTRQSVALAGVRVGHNGDAHAVDVTIEPLDEPAALRGTALIAFVDVAPPPASASRGKGARDPRRGDAHARSRELKQAQEELERARMDLRTTREEAQTAQEELKSTNEELQSTNEELQSTNEELTTSKEEMQSMNEELQTLNNELQVKVEDLSRASNDMRNLLDSTEIAVLFLDDALNVRRFTPQAARVIKLIPGDVGRPLADLATDLRYPELYDDAREVLRTLVFKETAVGSRSGRRFSVRIMPYRTNDNRIDGVVITLTAIPAVEAAAPSHGGAASRKDKS
jgi:two-component system CheB/CheR fusion protein